MNEPVVPADKHRYGLVQGGKTVHFYELDN